MLKFSRLTASGDIAKAYVGEIKKLWYIHEDLLCERSEYFKRAFQSGFKEGQEKEIYLAELDAEAFGQFVDWVYGVPLRVTVPTIGHSDAPSATELDQGLLFCKIYAAAQYLCMENLQNDAMDMYFSYVRSTQNISSITWYVANVHVEYIYSNTNRPSPMHDFMARAVANAILKGSMTGHWDSVIEQCPAFAIEVLSNIPKIQRRGEQDVLELPRCTFHVHEYTAKCVETLTSQRRRQSVQGW